LEIGNLDSARHSALQRLEIFDARLGTNEGDELKTLSVLFENYEKEFSLLEE
jgi:hypothetical protein